MSKLQKKTLVIEYLKMSKGANFEEVEGILLDETKRENI